MNKEDFIAKIADIIDCEEDLTFDTILPDIEEWDSIAVISAAAFLDSIGKKVTVEELKSVSTLKQLAELAGINE